MPEEIALILALINAGLNALQQGQILLQKHANGEDITEADLQSARDATNRVMAESDALRSTPRGS